MVALSEARPGASYTVKWNMNRNTDAAENGRFGLNTGANLYLLNSCFGGVVIRVSGKKVAIGHESAMRIKV